MNRFDYQNVILIAKTEPANSLLFPGSYVRGQGNVPPRTEDIISYCARVSNPDNQQNFATADKLLSYLIRNKHWSPFEMVQLVMEVTTTREIGRQILRHGSMRFQEFSGRYADMTQVGKQVIRETRLRDPKNRQKSILCTDRDLIDTWEDYQRRIQELTSEAYRWALDNNLAKESARVVLPEGLTLSRMYIAGTLRSWLHYCLVRKANGTQDEHTDIANKTWSVLRGNFDFLDKIDWDKL